MPSRWTFTIPPIADLLAKYVGDGKGWIDPFAGENRYGIKATQQDTQSNFYNRVMNAICDKIKVEGMAISCGWNSAGFGKNRGFEIIEILLVAHGGHHNDTIVTVERKNQSKLLLTGS